MKKTITILLVVAVLVMAFAGCSTQSSGDTEVASTDKEAVTDENEVADATDATDATDANDEVSELTPAQIPEGADLERTLLFNTYQKSLENTLLFLF